MNKRKLLLGVGLASAIGAGTWYGVHRYSTATTPEVPHISLDGVDRELVEAIETAREKVRHEPRSGTAWGNLGLVLIANGFDEQGRACLAHAERFDPVNPRWPYIHGIQAATVDPAQGMILLTMAL